MKSSKLTALLTLFLLLAGVAIHRPAAGAEPRLPVLTDKETWQLLPKAAEGADQPLPVWARMTVRSLPRTTAAMLELDFLHRARSPLGPKLGGKMRWVAAHANRCDYAEAYAAADLRRAGLEDAAINALADERADRPREEKAALAFARKMTLAASTVTDAEVAELVELHGEKQVVAMVLLLAYANFQDRLFLALGVSVEPGGPMPPVAVRFAQAKEALSHVEAPPRKMPEAPPGGVPERITDKEWLDEDFGRLQKCMADQRDRGPRVRVPTFEEVVKQLPAGATPPSRPVRIRWSLVCMGYQPEMAMGWSACTRGFAEDANQDRVFEESLFWVVTRTLHCFY
jgi:alkylhydroperoxidase family enzyme